MGVKSSRWGKPKHFPPLSQGPQMALSTWRRALDAPVALRAIHRRFDLGMMGRADTSRTPKQAPPTSRRERNGLHDYMRPLELMAATAYKNLSLRMGAGLVRSAVRVLRRVSEPTNEWTNPPPPKKEKNKTLLVRRRPSPQDLKRCASLGAHESMVNKRLQGCGGGLRPRARFKPTPLRWISFSFFFGAKN